jgi:hypothetical protein
MDRVQDIVRCVGPRWVISPVLLAAALLSGCFATTSNTEAPPAPPAPRAGPPAKPAALADMAGRWMLGSPGAGNCGMNFSGAPGAIEGTIAPEGGCPGNFFTSRRWAFDQGGLIIRNHTGEPLARLALAGPGHFDGQASTGEPVSLAR